MKHMLAIVLAIIISITMSLTAFAYPTNSVSVKVFQDKSYLFDYSGDHTYIHSALRRTNYPFVNMWDVKFNPGYYNVSGMPLEACPLGYFDSCIFAECGDYCKNSGSSPNHHKNFDYNSHFAENSFGYSEFDIMLMVSASELCHRDSNGNHSNGCLGMANYDNVMCKVSTGRTDIENVRVIQHEFSHLFGCGHCNSGRDDPCIMSGGFDKNNSFDLDTIWCSECTSDFDRTAF